MHILLVCIVDRESVDWMSRRVHSDPLNRRNEKRRVSGMKRVSRLVSLAGFAAYIKGYQFSL